MPEAIPRMVTRISCGRLLRRLSALEARPAGVGRAMRSYTDITERMTFRGRSIANGAGSIALAPTLYCGCNQSARGLLKYQPVSLKIADY